MILIPIKRCGILLFLTHHPVHISINYSHIDCIVHVCVASSLPASSSLNIQTLQSHILSCISFSTSLFLFHLAASFFPSLLPSSYFFPVFSFNILSHQYFPVASFPSVSLLCLFPSFYFLFISNSSHLPFLSHNPYVCTNPSLAPHLPAYFFLIFIFHPFLPPFTFPPFLFPLFCVLFLSLTWFPSSRWWNKQSTPFDTTSDLGSSEDGSGAASSTFFTHVCISVHEDVTWT